MKFSELEALIKDDIPDVDRKLILRKLKRVLGQINSIIPGLLKTVKAVDLSSKINYTVSGQIDGGNPPSGDIPIDSIYMVTTTGGAYAEKELWKFNGTIWEKITLVDGDRITLTMGLKGGNVEYSMNYIYEWDTGTSDWKTVNYIAEGFSYLDGKLTLSKLVKSTLTVLVDKKPWKRRGSGYVTNNPSYKCYWIPSYNEIIFAENSIAAATVSIEIHGHYRIPIPTSTAADTLIDVPESWEEGIIAGIIFYLIIGKHSTMEKDELNSIKAIYQPIFDRMIHTIGALELDRHPVEEVEQEFSYK